MRHGIREPGVDSSLLYFNRENLDESCPEIWNTIHRLKHHHIKKIVVSPYLRTRQTAEVFQYGYYKFTNRPLPIEIDTRIGEYVLPNPYVSKVCLDSKTVEYYNGRCPIYRESSESLLCRVRDFVKSLEPATLVISHNSVASLIGLFLGKQIELEQASFCEINISLKNSLLLIKNG